MLPALPSVSIVIPGYNEAKRIEQSMNTLNAYLQSNPHICEVLWVIEKSTDNTLELAKKFGAQNSKFQVIDNLVHRGKGYAVKSGMLKAKGDIVFFMDLDLSTDLDAINNFLDQFIKYPEVDLVIGNRSEEKSLIQKSQKIHRVLMGKFFNLILRITGLTEFKDTQCGFKAFKNSTAFSLFKNQQTHGFSFDVEILLLSKLFNYRALSMPVKWTNSEESKVRLVHDSLGMLLDIIKLKINIAFSSKIKCLKNKPIQSKVVTITND
jgi:dolichyl-phosphate beta-glucosyltransferase